MSPPNPVLRQQVIRIYKGNTYLPTYPPHSHSTFLDLLFMGREYPQGYDYYRTRLHKAFSSQKHLEDEAKIMDGIKRAEFVKKGMDPCVSSINKKRGANSFAEIEALYA
jgi:hypothetical protein